MNIIAIKNFWIVFLVMIGACLLGKITVRFVEVTDKVEDLNGKKSTESNYKGYKVLRVNIDNVNTIASINHFQQTHPQLDYWMFANAPGKSSDIMLPPDQAVEFKSLLNEGNISFSEMIEDVQRLLDEQEESRKDMTRLRQEYSGIDTIFFDRYPRLNEIDSWVQYLKSTYPNLIDTIEIGTTYEKRPMTVIKIGGKTPPPPTTENSTNTTAVLLKKRKPAIWIDSAIHAREWITVTTLLYFVSQLLEPERWSNDTKLHKLSASYLDRFDFYILPVHNPDGYEYTHTKNRLWRKTRSPNTKSTCFGTDANRNWGHSSFGSTSGAGSSSDPCSQVYHGSEQFSEIENVNVRDFLFSLKKDLVSFLSIHSYSQLWLLPYGHKYKHPVDYDVLYQYGLDAIQALKGVHGTEYQVGTISDLLYIATGSSLDWAYDVLKVKYSYGLELRDTGTYGFLLPPNQILPTAQETWEGYKKILNHLSEEY